MVYTWKVNQHDSSPIYYVNYKVSYIQNRKYIEEENKYRCVKQESKLSFDSPPQIDAE